MHVRPILSALRRSPTGAILVALQIALALAITVNSMYIIVQRLELIGRPSGLDEHNLFVVRFAAKTRDFDAATATREDMAILRGLPGVIDATTTNSVPLSGGGSAQQLFSEAGKKGQKADVNYFDVDEHGVDTLGINIVAGRNFDASAVQHRDPNSSQFAKEVLLSQVTADLLFPHGTALGQTVYDSLGQPAKVVGVYERMMGSWPSVETIEQTMITPFVAEPDLTSYLVRTKPGQRDAMMELAEKRLNEVDNGRIILKLRTLDYIIARSYADDHAMTVYLGCVIVLLLGISALGIFGLAAFNVSTRTKQIGTRRAVGARRLDIVRYFLVENLLITTIGVGVGCVLALLLGFWLSSMFELPRLKLYYLVGGAALLWVVGLVAALVPARRASLVSPAVATRTV
jgi:putative ABC transport system permease protein